MSSVRAGIVVSGGFGHGRAMPAGSRKQLSAPYLENLMLSMRDDSDKSAFVELFEVMAPRVKSFIMQGTTEDHVADDLTQEVMIRVWTRRAQYDPAKAAVSTWIYTIARNVRIDLFRKQKRHQLDENDPALHPPEPDDPDRQVDLGRQTEILKQAMSELPEEQLAVLKLSYFGGLSHQEIAVQTGTPDGTVKSRIRLALKKLRSVLKEY
ncbi:MAG: sigma-70 family RNA polymerase sigma factor [Aquisalinus sp.]|nr:sigma-70 family RNA polymerase sigma factor [Aquisalinus sp.]